MVADSQALVNQAYYSVVMHPDCWADVLHSEARWTWQSEYRDWRKVSRCGEQRETYDELLERVRRGVAELLTIRQKALEPRAIGNYQGVNVIAADAAFACDHDGPPCEIEFHPQGCMTVKPA